MWTMCWTDNNGNDKWERLDTREEVCRKANDLIWSKEVEPDDILVFPPEADDLSVIYDDLDEEEEEKDYD